MKSKIENTTVVTDDIDDAVERKRAFIKLSIYIFATVLVSCFLLLINVGMVFMVYKQLAEFIPEAYSAQLGQLILLFGPFMLLFPEWILYDILITPFRRWR